MNRKKIFGVITPDLKVKKLSVDISKVELVKVRTRVRSEENFLFAIGKWFGVILVSVWNFLIWSVLYKLGKKIRKLVKSRDLGYYIISVGFRWTGFLCVIGFFVFVIAHWLIPWIETIEPERQAGFGTYFVLLGAALVYFVYSVFRWWDDFEEIMWPSFIILVLVMLFGIPVGFIGFALVHYGLPVPLAIVLSTVFGPIIVAVVFVLTY